MFNSRFRHVVFAYLLLSIFDFSSFSSCSELPILNHSDISNSSYEEKYGDDQVIEVVANRKPTLSGIQQLPLELILLIADYLVNPVSSFGSIDLNYFGLFHGKHTLKCYLMKRFNIPKESKLIEIPNIGLIKNDLFDKKLHLKHYIMEHFNIPELESVDENEPELAGILSLEMYRNNTFALFDAISDDIFSGKRPYKNISRALIMYLARTFNELKNVTHQASNCPFFKQPYLFWSLLSDFSANSENFDFAFEYSRNNRNDLLSCFKNVENKKSMMEFFKANPDKAKVYQDAIILEASWIISDPSILSLYLTDKFAEYITYDAPDEFYGHIFASSLELTNLITSDLFLFQDIPDSEYLRIHGQIRKLFEIYPSQNLINNLEFYNLFIDLRFGVLDQLNNIMDFDKRRSLYLLAVAALLGNKPDIFLMINDRFNEIGPKNEVVILIMKIFTRKDVKISAIHKLNPIFELIVRDPEYFSAKRCIKFLLKFYALYDLKYAPRTGFGLEFVALDNSLILTKICFYNQRDFVSGDAQYAFSDMKVLNTNTLSSLMSCYNNLGLPKSIEVSFEVVKVVAKNPSLVENFRKHSLYFNGGCDDFKKYLDLPNFDETIIMFEPVTLRGFLMPIMASKFKSKRCLERIKKLSAR